MAEYQLIDRQPALADVPIIKLKLTLFKIQMKDQTVPGLMFTHGGQNRGFGPSLALGPQVLVLLRQAMGMGFLESLAQERAEVYRVTQLENVTYRQIVDLIRDRIEHVEAPMIPGEFDFMEHIFTELEASFGAPNQPGSSEVQFGQLIKYLVKTSDYTFSPKLRAYLKQQNYTQT